MQDALTVLLFSRIDSAIAEGARTVVVRNAGSECLNALERSNYRTFAEDMTLNFDWYSGLGDLQKLWTYLMFLQTVQW
jgi:hypothetical protein